LPRILRLSSDGTEPADAPAIPVRPVDGSGTHALWEDWGAVGQELLRLAPADYADGIGQMVEDRPDARVVSNAVAQQSGEMPNSAGLSNFFWAWGQFIDHDLDLTEAGGLEEVPMSVPAGDPWFDPTWSGEMEMPFTRVVPMEDSGQDSPRAYANQITAFLDAGPVYGSDAATAAALRGEGGRIALDANGLLPRSADGGVLAGDVRAAENVALTALHTLFAREHNHWVASLKQDHPDWGDDDLYAAARQRVEAEIQAITYNEFLPILVGEDAIAGYRGYDPTVNPGISAEFSTAAYRFGHSLLSSALLRVEEDGSAIAAGPLALRDAFFNPDQIADNGGIAPLLRGLAGGHAQELDNMVVEDVRSFLFGAPGSGGMDLASLNIQRGRDLGIPSYNDLREALGLEPAEDFDDITSDPALAAQLAMLYGDIALVDAWVGGLAEDTGGGGLLGETFSLVVIDQFERVRDGDPFWSQAGKLGEEEQAALWETTLADIVERNGGVGAVQDNAFLAFERMGGDESGDRIDGDSERQLVLGFAGRDILCGKGGDDQIEGGEGDDVLRGGRGDDLLRGGSGGDTFCFTFRSDSDTIADFDADDELVVKGVGYHFDFERQLREVDGGVLLHISRQAEVLIEGVDRDELDLANFSFTP